jgi:2-hydroxycyclohexanecarboxyl-CoA dehydrogenase
MRGLNGKTVIVTGGASGIGRASALRLAAEGCLVAIFDLNAKGGEETAGEIRREKGEAQSFVVDVSDYAGVKEATGTVEATFGPVELLANVAGWDVPKPFLESDQAFWDKVIRINLYGPLVMHHVVVAGMAARGFGRVVNISSDAGRVGSSGEAVYSACKGGLIAFTKTLARELARRGVTLNTICPGPTDTPLFEAFTNVSPSAHKLGESLARAIPMRRLGRPDDYPGMIAFLLSDDAGFITGQTISVSGGLTMHG